MAANEHVAPVWRHQPGNHRHRRRLARAVGPEQPDELPWRERERHVVDGDERAERLPKASDGQHDGTVAWPSPSGSGSRTEGWIHWTKGGLARFDRPGTPGAATVLFTPRLASVE